MVGLRPVNGVKIDIERSYKERLTIKIKSLANVSASLHCGDGENNFLSEHLDP